MPGAVAAWIVTATAATGVAALAIHAGVALLFSAAVSKLTRPKGRSPSDNQIELRQSDALRTRYLGKNRVSGAVMYWDVHRKALWKLLAVAQGGHSGVIDWYINDEKATLSGFEVVSGPSSGKLHLHARSGRGGERAGGAHPELIEAAPAWTGAHRLDGVGTFLVRAACVKAEDAQEKFPGGEPSITAVIEGDVSAHIYGGGSGVSDNLVRQLFDIFVHPDYGPLSVADMDQPAWLAARVDADDPIPTVGGDTRPRYAGGGGYQLAEPIKDIADRWLEAMAGTVYLTTEGRVAIRVGKWRAPTYTITEDRIVSLEYGAGAGSSRIDGVASLVPKYTSSALGYKETTADAWEDAAAIARWGETAAKELPLPIVHHHGQARALAKIKLAKLNAKWRLTVKLRFWGLLLLEEEAVYVNLPRLGLINEPFWIDSYAFDPAGTDGICTVELIHADPTSFDFTAAEEGTAPVVPTDTDGGVERDPPAIAAVEVITDDGAPFIRVMVDSDEASTPTGQYRKTGSSGPWTNMISGGFGGVLRTLGLQDASEYDVRVAAAIFGAGTQAVSAWTVVEGVEVVNNRTAPDPPVVVSTADAADGGFAVTFEPDLGVNYSLTELWKGVSGSAFADAELIKRSFSTSSQVTMTDSSSTASNIYWLRSINPSGVSSVIVEVLI